MAAHDILHALKRTAVCTLASDLSLLCRSLNTCQSDSLGFLTIISIYYDISQNLIPIIEEKGSVGIP